LRREGRLPRSPYIRPAREHVSGGPDALPREPAMTLHTVFEMDDYDRALVDEALASPR